MKNSAARITAVLAVISVILLAVTGAGYFLRDRSAPVISVPDSDITYVEGTDTASLLDGVTAKDDRDGDVTDTLRVENILPSGSGRAVVVYIAKDTSNNIAKVSRAVNYTAADESADAENQETTEQNAEDVSAESASEEVSGTSAAEDASASQAASAEEEENAEEENQKKIDALSASAPRLYLKQYEVTLQEGGRFNSMSYLDRIEDDEDSSDSLFRRVHADGAENVDTSKEGTYSVEYYVTDSDGNRSNEAELTVRVE